MQRGLVLGVLAQGEFWLVSRGAGYQLLLEVLVHAGDCGCCGNVIPTTSVLVGWAWWSTAESYKGLTLRNPGKARES